jgi:hypothetical protein
MPPQWDTAKIMSIPMSMRTTSHQYLQENIKITFIPQEGYESQVTAVLKCGAANGKHGDHKGG